MKVDEGTRSQLIDHTALEGDLHRGDTEEEHVAFANRVADMLKLITSCREYQLG